MDYPCGIGSIAQSRYTYRYPHGYSAEEKYLASGRRRTRTVDVVRSGYRDNRAELSPTWTDQIDYSGSKNPRRTSYVKQDGVSIKWKETERSGNITQAHLMAHESTQCRYLQSNNTAQQKKYPELNATHGNTYNSFTSPHSRLPQAFTQTQ